MASIGAVRPAATSESASKPRGTLNKTRDHSLRSQWQVLRRLRPHLRRDGRKHTAVEWTGKGALPLGPRPGSASGAAIAPVHLRNKPGVGESSGVLDWPQGPDILLERTVKSSRATRESKEAT